jgi:peptidyl-prolyl cis-trans isomerase SurA
MGRMFVLLVLAFTILFHRSTVRGEIVDRIVAIVNDEIITLSELERFRETFYPEGPSKNDWLGKEVSLLKARRRALLALIDEKLIEQEAERQEITIPEERVERTVDALREEQKLTQGQLEMMLNAQGLTYGEYENEVARRLKRVKLINRAIKSKIEIKEEDLERYYQAHIHAYMADASIRISHVLLPFSPNSSSQRENEVLSLAQKIKKSAESGHDLGALAQEHAGTMPGIRGGDLGYFKRGEMIPALEDEAFSLEIGEVGNPVRTPEGIVLIRVTDRKTTQPIPLEEIREKVEMDYYTREVERQYQEWINKLREKAVIEMRI